VGVGATLLLPVHTRPVSVANTAHCCVVNPYLEKSEPYLNSESLTAVACSDPQASSELWSFPRAVEEEELAWTRGVVVNQSETVITAIVGWLIRQG